jgi:ferric-dicitrate binding protein FerR (iron transport regulator)
MKDQHRESLQELECALRAWAESDPAIDAAELEKILRARLPERRCARRVRLALAAAAVSAALIVVGLEVARNPRPEPALQNIQEIYDVPDNAILVLRDNGPPIYVLTEPEPTEGVTP